jgi:hypothetical protein
LAVIAAGIPLSGCASDSVFPAVHDMPAARSETKLTPEQIKQATDDLISDRDRTEAQASPPATTGSTAQRKPTAPAQATAQPASSGISAYAKQ